MIAFTLSAMLLTMPVVEAELLLRATDAKIAAAKTLRIDFEVAVEGGGLDSQVAAGTFLIADRYRFRVEHHGLPWLLLYPEGYVMVGDGKEMAASRVGTDVLGPLIPPRIAVPPRYTEFLKSRLGREDPLQLLHFGDDRVRNSAPAVLWRVLPDEEVDGIRCRVVEQVAPQEKANRPPPRIWIDAKTGLPLRRTVPEGPAGQRKVVAATQIRFEIDPKLDDKLFELGTESPRAVLQGEAKEILRRMDEAIAAAKSLRIEFHVAVPDGETVSGVLALDGRNRVRLEVARPRADERVVVLVSDGKRVGGFGPTGKRVGEAARPLPDWHNKVLRAWIGRVGPMLALSEMSERGQKPDAKRPGSDEGPQVENVRLLPDKAVNGVRCRVVGYAFAKRGDDPLGHVRMRVWVDPNTWLPVRHEAMLPGAGTVTQTYSKFELNPKLDGKLFEVPK